MVEWVKTTEKIDYTEAITWMEARVDAIIKHRADECIWLLEHPPIFTLGSSATPTEAASKLTLPVIHSGRGGRITYHGPGQRVIYVMLDLNQRGRDLRKFISQCEQWIINALADHNVNAFRLSPHTGVWTNNNGEDLKIAAIGLRIRQWVTYHGISVNVDPDLSHYDSIIPCGIEGKGITSLIKCDLNANMASLDQALQSQFECCFPLPN